MMIYFHKDEPIKLRVKPNIKKTVLRELQFNNTLNEKSFIKPFTDRKLLLKIFN